MIPDEYVPDLPVRLALYRRLAEIENERDIEAFGAELVDRFGKLPREVDHLLRIVAIKSLCRRANVEKVEAGPKGVVLAFRDATFANPDGLIAYIREQGPAARVRPDMKVVLFDDWERPEERLKGTTAILRRIAAIAEQAKAA
jgi:transcription-repair coupling factor (superfamily II helicase)